MPIEQTMKMMNIPYNNYKTQTCKYYELSGGNCKFGKNCSFAHGGVELRNPYDALPLGATSLTNPSPSDMLGSTNAGTMSEVDTANITPVKQPDVKIILNDPTNDQLKLKIIQASAFLQAGQKDEGMQIINELLLSGEISVKYPRSYNSNKANKII